jgi:hypothetical protein
VKPPVKGAWCRRHAYHVYAALLDPEALGGRSRDEIVTAVAKVQRALGAQQDNHMRLFAEALSLLVYFGDPRRQEIRAC